MIRTASKPRSRACISTSASDANYAFAFFTGLRASEQIAVTWADHDRTRGLLRIERARV
jgi:hypothetical protein